MQKLWLGDDCLKYMRKTPKAPADIDNWVIDPPNLNTSIAIIGARKSFDLLIPSNNGTSPATFSPDKPSYINKVFIHYFAFVCISLNIVDLIACSGTSRRFLIKFLDGKGRKSRFLRDHVGRNGPAILAILLLIGLLTCLYLIVVHYHKEVAPWSAAADFLNTCKDEKVCSSRRY